MGGENCKLRKETQKVSGVRYQVSSFDGKRVAR